MRSDERKEWVTIDIYTIFTSILIHLSYVRNTNVQQALKFAHQSIELQRRTFDLVSFQNAWCFAWWMFPFVDWINSIFKCFEISQIALQWSWWTIWSTSNFSSCIYKLAAQIFGRFDFPGVSDCIFFRSKLIFEFILSSICLSLPTLSFSKLEKI